MKAATYIPRAAGIVALAVLFVVNGLASNRKSRVFNAQFDAVWTAASEVANDAFLADRTSKAGRQIALSQRTVSRLSL